jgi:NitT/TauT family transport system substrate-binding protein
VAGTSAGAASAETTTSVAGTSAGAASAETTTSVAGTSAGAASAETTAPTAAASSGGTATTAKRGTGTTATTNPRAATTTTAARKAVTVRLGYFPNVTHATAIVGVSKGFFQNALGKDSLKTSLFNAGPAATEALFSNAIDASYMGPNPAINAYAQSNGSAIRIISGATSGGALLVVRPDINSAADLKGKKVATPQLGNTQDVALRSWLAGQGLKTDTNGGGDVSVVPQDNSQTLQTFKTGTIAGAWVPEPWATRMVQQGGGKVLVDERSLWPNGQFVTTLLAVRTDFLNAHPDVVKELLEGAVDANDWMAANPADAQQIVDAGISVATGTNVGLPVVSAAWKNMTFTNDPIASSLAVSAQHAQDLGLLQPIDLKKIFDLSLLNQILAARGKPTAAAL